MKIIPNCQRLGIFPIITTQHTEIHVQGHTLASAQRLEVAG